MGAEVHRAAQKISRELGISSRAAIRILSATSTSPTNRVSQEQIDQLASGTLQTRKLCFRVGFGLDDPAVCGRLRDTNFINLVIQAVKEYRASCPLVYRWLVSGNFEPDLPPGEVSDVVLKHATRTVGRLRAGVMRGCI